MSVLLVHGAGYKPLASVRYLQRERLRTGLAAGFLSAEKVAESEMLSSGLSSAPFEVRLAEYGAELNRRNRASVPALDVVPLGRRYEWGDIEKVRCLCCRDTARGVRRNVGDWIGNAGKDNEAATRQYIERRMSDVARYMRGGSASRDAVSIVRNQIDSETRVVVGHSLGSVVVVDALARVPTDELPQLIVTTGSPLRFSYIRTRLAAGVVDWIRDRPVAWVNVHDRGDMATAGGSLPRRHYPGVLNIAVYNGSHAHDGDYYLRHRVVGALIWAVATGEVVADDLRHGLLPELRHLVKYR